MAFLGKHYALKDWLIFSEVFGMPVRIARYEPQASPGEKHELLEMLRNLGADAVGVFSKAVELEIKESIKPAGSTPYETLCNFLNREMSKAWLGQTLTTDTAGSTGTFSAAAIHERVRQDLREDDIRKEGRTIRKYLLRPLVQAEVRPGGAGSVLPSLPGATAGHSVAGAGALGGGQPAGAEGAGRLGARGPGHPDEQGAGGKRAGQQLTM